ncbi:MAG TPA: alanyl-tRNA editing protein [Thermoanaerobaculia bacterium]|nr:alanyl-tRNA editing protein [Thermoanaerobaculia bacterium]
MTNLPAYERDPRLRELDVEVLATGDEGGRAWVRLSDTVLYPEGGGQPADRGWLGEVPVEDVQRRDGDVRHYLAGPVSPGPARLRLDWARRFDHMQQHTAQHLLSALAADRFGWETTSFHLGPATCDVELGVAALPAAVLAQLEEAIAAAVREALPVSTRRVPENALASLAVRSRGLPAGHVGDVRLVEIAGLDLNTCGGTHLASTAEIECVKLLGSEPMRGGTRLQWVAGGRVRTRLAAHEARTESLRRTLEAADDELVAVAAARIAQLRDAERLRRRLDERLADAEVARLLAAAPTGAFVDAHFDDADGSFLQRVSSGFAAGPGTALALLTAQTGDAAFFALAAQGGATVDLKALGVRAAAALAGRGGGSGRLYQGKAGSLAGRAALVEELAGLQRA